MRRYLVTLYACWRASIEAELEYRLNFLVTAVTSVGTVAAALFTLSLFYRPGLTLGGWSWTEVLIVVGFYTMLEGVQASLLAPNYQRLSTHIREGTLDFVLLKPLDSQFVVSTNSFSPWGLPDVLVGVSLIAYAAAQQQPPLPASAILTGLLPFGLAIVILYSMSFLLATLNIYFTKLWNLNMALQSVLQAGRYPVQAYPAGYRALFTYIIPVVFLTTVPAQAVTGKHAPEGWIGAAAVVALVLLIACRLFWRYALRHYTSASS